MTASPEDGNPLSPDSPDKQAQRTEIPQAVLRSPDQVSAGRLVTRLWWLTGVCGVLAIGLIVSSFRSQGTAITLRFEDGYGLKAGDTLRYRGIDVGMVTGVKISKDLQGVVVSILLSPGNEKIAVEGSQFWIQRPRLRLGSVTGLDTVLGAKYVGVIPGDPDAPTATDFDGIETPLAITDGESSEIEIRFPAGEGLEVGDPVRFRGIAIGEVTYLELDQGLQSVSVGVRLVGVARQLARAGTQFWIERPRLDLTEIRGLETLIGGRYIALQPNSQASELRSQFVGLAEPPPLPRRDGSLEIELDASRRLGVVRGAPIIYRGLEVGRVSNVGLANDGASVKIGAIVDTEYAELVRENSKWWAVGGVELDASLSGIRVSIESLSSWIRGGIAFATPPAPGEHVVTGHRFMMEAEPQPEWLDWQPRIAVAGNGTPPGGRTLPQPVRVVASWKASWLGLYRRRTRETWGIAMSDGSLRVPASFVRHSASASDQVTIEVAGKSMPFDDQPALISEEVAKLEIPAEAKLNAWPAAQITQSWSAESVLLVVNPELTEPLAIDGTRVSKRSDIGLTIAPGVAIASPLEGSPVVDATSGKLIGLLMAAADGWMIGFVE